MLNITVIIKQLTKLVFSEKYYKIFIWFFITLVGSFVPSLFRLLIYSSGVSIKAYDIKDTLFAALTMVLSNFALVGQRSGLENRIHIIVFSIFTLIFISLITGIFLFNENTPNYSPSNFLANTSYFFTAASVYLSYSANNTVYKSV